MPYVHVVVLKLKPDATAEQKASILDGLAALPSQIPEILTFRVGLDLKLDPSGCHVGAVGTFESVDSYDVYAKHPAHVGVIEEHIKPVLEQRAAAQFTADDGVTDWTASPPPLTHVVLLKLKDDATPEQKKAIVAALRRLPAAINQIKRYRVGRDAGNDRAGFDLAIVGDFTSADDYGSYAKHQQHVGVITALIKPILAERVAVQFSPPPLPEAGGPPLGLLSARPDIVPPNASTIELDVGRGTTLRGRAWGPEDGEPWLVLHGWLDNCASFDYLCPLLTDGGNRFVCLDVAGAQKQNTPSFLRRFSSTEKKLNEPFAKTGSG